MKDRRELLKGLAIGSVWSVPVVQSIIIPAHGATTCGELELFNDSNDAHSLAATECYNEETGPECEYWIACMAEFCIDATFQDCV
jgi:hypothetical protein